jgi:hypothetical protein
MGIGTARSGSGLGPAMGPRLVDSPVRPGAIDQRSPILAKALAVIDHSVAALQSNAASGGVCRVQLDPLPAGLVALVDRIFVTCDSAAGTTLGVFVGGEDAKSQRDYAPSGNKNVADLTPPIYVGPTQPLIIRWEGADAGAIGVATIQYRICAVVETTAQHIAGLGA